VAKFQGAQKRFKDLVATVRDEKSFDAAKPELDKVVSDWREVATTLGQLQPPTEMQQVEIRDLIAVGHRRTEPTGEDMLSLISIESREAEVAQWLEEFAVAGGKAGVEMSRLYGPTDHAAKSAEEPGIDSVNAALIESSLVEAMKKAEAGADQTAAAPKSGPDGKDKSQPESKSFPRKVPHSREKKKFSTTDFTD
jgi:hypothetical protein